MFSTSPTSTRRGFLGCAVLGGMAALLIGTAAPAQAGDVEAEAQQFIDSLARATVAIAADHDMPADQRGQRLRALLERGFDTQVISRFVLGRHWRDASAAQQAEFVSLFRDYTVASYARRFESYAGQTLQIVEARDQGGEEGKIKVLVHSVLQSAGSAPVKVDWRLRQTADGWRIYDVVVEGVSMVLTQRSEFSAVILRHGNGLDGLLEQLRKRTAQLEAEAARRTG